ncbi:histidine kinase, partial [Erysipelatoclostridium ramosum]|nr:histidine kinase [Thomasclavelia ramosa]
GCMGVVVLSNYTMNGLLAEILLRYEMWDGISLLANLAAWMLLFAYLSIIFFLLKYIIAHGVIRYLKEGTFIGSIIRRFK